MSYITADCLMNRKLFSSDRHNSLTDSLRLQQSHVVTSGCGSWTGYSGAWVVQRLKSVITKDCGFPVSHETSATHSWKRGTGDTQWPFGMRKVKVLSQHHLEMNCRRTARILKPRAVPALHSSGFEACAVRRTAPLLHGKVSGCCHLLQEGDGGRVAAVNLLLALCAR